MLSMTRGFLDIRWRRCEENHEGGRRCADLGGDVLDGLFFGIRCGVETKGLEDMCEI